MVQVKSTELPKKISKLMDKVESGESIQIMKSGRPVAVLYSLVSKGQGWKRDIKKVKLPEKISAQSYIEKERAIS
jgi:prevent-host-death family protein